MSVGAQRPGKSTKPSNFIPEMIPRLGIPGQGCHHASSGFPPFAAASLSSAMTATWPLMAAVSHTVTRANSFPFVTATPVGILFLGSIRQGLLYPLVPVPDARIKPDVNAVMLQIF